MHFYQIEPTKKQLDFIDDICDTLKIKKPNCKTKGEASQWISKHIGEYKAVYNEFDFGPFVYGAYLND